MRAPKRTVTPTEALCRIFLPVSESFSSTNSRYQCFGQSQRHPTRSIRFTSRCSQRTTTSPSPPEDAFARIVREREEKRKREREEKLQRAQQWRSAQSAAKESAAQAHARDGAWDTPHPPPAGGLKYRVPVAPHPPLDEEIKSRMVRVKDPGTGQMGEPVPLRQALSRLNRRDFFLVQANAEVDDPSGHGGSVMAICKIMERGAVYEEARSKQAKQSRGVETRESKGTPKGVEVHWKEDPHSLQLKVKRLEAFLREGKKVQVTLKHKKKHRGHFPQEESEKVLRIVREAADGIPGVKETKAMTGLLGVHVVLFFEIV